MKSALPWAIGESFLSAASSLLTTLTVARLVLPEELGLAAIAIAIPMVVQALLLTGPTNALIRTPRIDVATLDSMTWCFLVLGVIGWLFCIGVAPVVALLYDHSELIPLLQIYGASCFLQAAMSVPTALLTRKMRTRTLALRTLGQKIATLVVTLSTALLGWGSWAIVIGSLVGFAIATAVLLYRQPRRPRLYFSWNAIVPILKLGGLNSIETLAGAITPRAFLLVFGRVQGLEALGWLNFGIRLVDELANILSMAITRMSLPFFSALTRSGIDDRDAFLRGSHLIVGVSAPVLFGLAAIASDLIPIVFGDRWTEAILTTQIVSIVWALKFTRVLSSALLLARGSQAPQIANSWIAFATGTLAAAAVGNWPFQFAVWSYVVPTLITVPLGIYMLKVITGMSALSQIRCVLKPLLISAGMFLALLYLRNAMIDDLQPIWRVFISVACGICSYVALVLLIDRHSWQNALRNLR
ncbi:oligosaccharide flippase family protein [Flaviflagellibacter deserti]|uniref:Oligosaccharide flippase family protein n=1 Tax=Flaviflagellibacter deserti TaxID=2267266 RepID=A0ABV9Z3W5_9HYPH